MCCEALLLWTQHPLCDNTNLTSTTEAWEPLGEKLELIAAADQSTQYSSNRVFKWTREKNYLNTLHVYIKLNKTNFECICNTVYIFRDF